MRRRLLLIALPVLFFGYSAPNGDWTAYGHDAFGTRYSPLTQIDRSNVSRLTVAWQYRTGERDMPTRRQIKFEATPLVIDGAMYLSTPLGKAIALDAASGAV